MVSIHAPAWGATTGAVSLERLMQLFQSTRPRGARPGVPFITDHNPLVSIHAPAWGATSENADMPSRNRCFNPRARVGRDMASRPPVSRREGFNPRARVGRDKAWYVLEAILPMFQSTRPRGARHRKGVKLRHCGRVSIHAPAWGATSSS